MKISIYVCTLWQYYYVETVPAPTRVTKSSGFQCSGSEMLDFWKLKKYNKLVKNYFQMKFESADLIYWPRGIQKCNKIGGIIDSVERFGFWKKSSTNRSGVFYVHLMIHQHNNTPTQKYTQYTNTTIHQHNNTPTQQYTNTTIQQHDNTPTWQYTNTTIHQHDNTPTRQYTNITIHQHDNTPTQQCTNRTIHQHDNTPTQQYTNTTIHQHNNTPTHQPK